MKLYGPILPLSCGCSVSQLRIVEHFKIIRERASHERHSGANVQAALQESAIEMWDDASVIVQHVKEIQTRLGAPNGYPEVSDVQDLGGLCGICDK